MSSPAIDYAALAEQVRISTCTVDYAALSDQARKAAPQRTIHNDSAGKPKPGTPHADDGIPDTGVMGALFTPARGVQQIGKGVQRIGNPQEGETLGGISDVVQGAMKVASPYAPQAIVAAPVAAATSLVGGGLGARVAGDAARSLNASPGAQELAETTGSVVGAGAGAVLGSKATPALRNLWESGKNVAAIAKDLAKDPQLLTEAIGVVSPRLAHIARVGGRLKDFADAVQTAQAARIAPVQGPPAAPAPATPIAAAPAVDPILDQIAQGELFKKPSFSALSPDEQAMATKLACQVQPKPVSTTIPAPEVVEHVKTGPSEPKGHTIQDQLQQYLEQQRAKAPAAAAPAADAGPVTAENLTDRLSNLLRDSKTAGGFDPDVPLGEVRGGQYLNRFGGSDSPVIDSSKRRVDSTAAVANPSKLQVVPSPNNLKSSKAYKNLLKRNPEAARKAMDLAIELDNER